MSVMLFLGLLCASAVISKMTVKSAKLLIPDECKKCLTFSDFWEAYQKVFPNLAKPEPKKG